MEAGMAGVSVAGPAVGDRVRRAAGHPLAAYAGTTMSDPTLACRLGTLDIPALVLWGDSDRIADPDYGRAYADAIPLARFRLLPGTGHAPQQETPGLVLRAIWDGAHPGPADPAFEPGDQANAQNEIAR
jgi:pimeloyl-ACP methyl ester carboxylesterase